MLSSDEEGKLLNFLSEDIGVGDITSNLLDEKKTRASIIAENNGIVAGVEEASFLFQHFGVGINKKVEDGKKIEKKEAVMKLEGNNKIILSVERTALNILSRMSSVASACRKASEIAGKFGVRVAVTRKTLPGFRIFEKKAASLGGADTHRFNLSDMVLIKDNHLYFFKNVSEAVKKAKRDTSFSKKIEIEVENLEQAVQAAKQKPDIIMLDNFSVGEAKRAIGKIRKIGDILVELSGGITLSNLENYASLRPDVISMGALSYSAPYISFSLEIEKNDIS